MSAYVAVCETKEVPPRIIISFPSCNHKKFKYQCKTCLEELAAPERSSNSKLQVFKNPLREEEILDAIIISGRQSYERYACIHGYYFISCKICNNNRDIEANEIVIDLESSADIKQRSNEIALDVTEYTVKRGNKRRKYEQDEDYNPKRKVRRKVKD
jgi:hypothetical protein